LDALSKDELRALLAAAKAARERDWLMILIGFWHGLRVSEVIALTPDSFKDEHIFVRRLKGSKATRHPLMSDPDPLLSETPAVFDYIRGMHSNQRAFPITRQHFWRLIRKYALAAGIPEHKAHPHVLKHTIAMQSIEHAGIENVRAYLGHVSIASTGSYLKVTDAEAAASVQRALSGSQKL
jgi:integrase/recombinase XerD